MWPDAISRPRRLRLNKQAKAAQAGGQLCRDVAGRNKQAKEAQARYSPVYMYIHIHHIYLLSIYIYIHIRINISLCCAQMISFELVYKIQ